VKIETERLSLRRVTVDDLEELVAIHTEPDIQRFVGGLDLAEAARWLVRDDQSWDERGYGRVAITERRTGRLLGRTGLGCFPEFSDPELGWTIRRDAWGNGYATEAARAAAVWAFQALEIDRLISLIDPSNARSIRLARRLGMTAAAETVTDGKEVVVYWTNREAWLAGDVGAQRRD
jgi:RimJ/RimL family protein N-acetyltransferase